MNLAGQGDLAGHWELVGRGTSSRAPKWVGGPVERARAFEGAGALKRAGTIGRTGDIGS